MTAYAVPVSGRNRLATAVRVVASGLAIVSAPVSTSADTQTNQVACKIWLFGISEHSARYFPLISTADPKATLARFSSLLARHEAQLLSNPTITANAGGTAEYQIGGQVPTVSSGDTGDIRYVDYGFNDRCMPEIDPKGAVSARLEITYTVPVRNAPLRTVSTEQFSIDVRGTKALIVVRRYVDANWPPQPSTAKQSRSQIAEVATIVVLEPVTLPPPPSAAPSADASPAPSPSPSAG